MSLSHCEKCFDTPCRCGHHGYGLIPKTALNTTFCLEYSPNCKKKYMVRLSGYRRGMIDKKGIASGTNDAIGYGDTFEEAFNEAIKQGTNQRLVAEKTKKLSS